MATDVAMELADYRRFFERQRDVDDLMWNLFFLLGNCYTTGLLYLNKCINMLDIDVDI